MARFVAIGVMNSSFPKKQVSLIIRSPCSTLIKYVGIDSGRRVEDPANNESEICAEVVSKTTNPLSTRLFCSYREDLVEPSVGKRTYQKHAIGDAKQQRWAKILILILKRRTCYDHRIVVIVFEYTIL